MQRVTGIGGFFFRAKDPAGLAAWYEANLGIPSMDTKWSWTQQAGPTVFAPFPTDTDYFGGLEQQTMLNFRVETSTPCSSSCGRPAPPSRTR